MCAVVKKMLKKDSSLKTTFDDLLIKSVDEVLTTLGEPVKNELYAQLSRNFDIEKYDIANRIVDFSNILHQIFGLGASRLELLVLKKLQSKIQVDVKWPSYEWPLSKWIIMDTSFTEFIYRLRQSFNSKNDEKVKIGIADSPLLLIATA